MCNRRSLSSAIFPITMDHRFLPLVPAFLPGWRCAGSAATRRLIAVLVTHGGAVRIDMTHPVVSPVVSGRAKPASAGLDIGVGVGDAARLCLHLGDQRAQDAITSRCDNSNHYDLPTVVVLLPDIASSRSRRNPVRPATPGHRRNEVNGNRQRTTWPSPAAWSTHRSPRQHRSRSHRRSRTTTTVGQRRDRTHRPPPRNSFRRCRAANHGTLSRGRGPASWTGFSP